MFCPVVGWGTFSADDSQEAVLDFFALLIYHQGVPVAVFVRGFAQLAGQRQLRFALFAEERAFLVEFLDECAVEPEQMNGASNASVSAPASLLYT